MEKRTAALSLLFLTVIVAGCTDSNTTGKVEGQAIRVTQLDITPTQIREDSTVRISMGVRNVGEVSSEVQVGDNGNKILTNYCSDFFTIQENDFSSYSSSNSETQQSYELAPQEEVKMNWELKQEGDVPLNGYSCDMKFQVPFNYSVEAFKQIQIKKNEEVGGEPQLSSKSSQGPLTIDMGVTGSSLQLDAPVFLEGDKPEVLIGFANERVEESKYQGLISLKNPEISANKIEFEEGQCPEEGDKEEIQLYEGKSAQPIRCDLVYSRGGSDYTLGSMPSIKPEITVSANYTYTLNVGERTVEVLYSGN